MGGRSVCSAVVSLAVLAAACSEKPTDAPTSPDFAPPVQTGCNTTELSNLIKAEFGNASNEAKLATDLKNYGAKTSQATYVGYQLLDAIAVKYEGSANQAPSLLNPSNAAKAILKCIEVGTATIPTSFESDLGPDGAFAVRGFQGDNRTVRSHNLVWLLEPPVSETPPTLQTWESITTLATTGLADSVDNLFLAHGSLVEDTEGFTGDALIGTVFDWNTIPTATFGAVTTTGTTQALAVNDVGVVVGECPSFSGYIQHNSASDPDVTVGGFVTPSCYVVLPQSTLRERAPRSFAERITRFFSPTPAYAALLEQTTKGTGTGRRTLSPFGLIDPEAVNLKALFTWKTKANYVAGVKFATTLGLVPKYEIKSGAGTDFNQDFVLIWLEGVTNNGIKKKICKNYAFTNANGVAQFPEAYTNEPGGLIVVAHTTGTSSKPGVEEGAAPTVPAGQSLPSPGINVKNGPVASCPDSFKEGDELPVPPGPNGIAP